VVIFVGFANKDFTSLPDGEVWTINHGHKFGFRIDRLFELHQKDNLEDPNCYTKETRELHIKFLRAPHDFPVYMQASCPEYPASVEYPLSEALKITDDKRRFASSFDYMAAMAIIEGVDTVYIHGFAMDYYETEYRYQKPNALYWIGRMEGAGIRVHADDLFPEAKLYGYEQAQMVGRHTLEEHKKRYEKQYAKFLAEANIWRGVFQERSQSGGDINEAAAAVRSYEYSAAGAQAAADAIQNLIDVCDLREA
jgi:hypothetical protein